MNPDQTSNIAKTSRSRRCGWLLFLCVVLGLLAVFFMKRTIEEWDEPSCTCRTWSEIVASDTLRVVAYPSSTTVYRSKDQWQGYEYYQAKTLAEKLGMELELLIAPGEQAMLDSLREGIADIAIAPVAFSVAEVDSCVAPCGLVYEVSQVLLSARKLPITAKDSAKFSLAVVDSSRQVLLLNEPICDSLPDWRSEMKLRAYIVDTLPTDSHNADQLIDAVLDGNWDACLISSTLAPFFNNFFPAVRISKPLAGTEDQVAWMVSIKADTLRHMVDSLMAGTDVNPRYPLTDKRSYEKTRGRHTHQRVLMSDGHISVYDEYFRRHAQTIGWDWRLLAAVAFVESRFEPSAEHRGAHGVMQLMARTAEGMGFTEEQLDNPDCNIEAGAKLLAYLENCLRRKISRTCFPETQADDVELTDQQREIVERDLVKFTLASYNAGMGHVFDAIALADTLGYDAAAWDYNVAHCLQLKAEPEFYNLPCVSLGRFNGNFTCNYVRRVLENYEDFKEQVE